MAAVLQLVEYAGHRFTVENKIDLCSNKTITAVLQLVEYAAQRFTVENKID